jgi:enoyl-CoA hydratase/carnithine racemase
MMVAAKLLPVMDLRRLQEMAYLGEGFTAAAAEACGLITRSVPQAELDTVLSSALAMLGQGSPAAIQAGKQALREMRDMEGRHRLAFAERAIADLSQSPEALEGRAAFAEKRKPWWVG